MKTGQFPFLNSCKLLVVVALCCVPAISAAVDEEELGGWTQNYTGKPEIPWQEQDEALPPYPEKKNLMDLGIATDDMQYTVYLDKPSLVLGDDGVVRYTVVLVSDSGVWNVSHEGLRCGEKQFRRYAYGIDGKWQPLSDSPWRALREGGANRYRRILYADYFCNPMRSYRSTSEMIDMFNENWHEM